MDKPLVSILINSYNNETYIEECILSAINQTYDNIEIIVYDDGSTDGSKQLISKFENQITFINAKENYNSWSTRFNQANAVYQAFKIAKGAIICLLDSDDAFCKNKVEKVVEVFAHQTDVVMVQHQLFEIDKQSKKNNIIRPNLYVPSNGYLSYIFKTHALNGLFAPTSALSFSHQHLSNVLPIIEDKNGHLAIDARLTRTSIFHGQIVTLLEPLSLYRLHEDNWMNQLQNDKFNLALVDQLYDFFNTLAVKHKYPSISYKMYRIKKWSSWKYLKNKFRLS